MKRVLSLFLALALLLGVTAACGDDSPNKDMMSNEYKEFQEWKERQERLKERDDIREIVYEILWEMGYWPRYYDDIYPVEPYGGIGDTPEPRRLLRQSKRNNYQKLDTVSVMRNEETIKARLITLAVKTSPGVSIEELAESVYGEYAVTDGRLEYAVSVIRSVGQVNRPIHKAEKTELSLKNNSWEDTLAETPAEKWADEAIAQDDELTQIEDQMWTDLKGLGSVPSINEAIDAVAWVKNELFGQDKYPSFDFEEGRAEFPELVEELQDRVDSVENYIVEAIIDWVPTMVDKYATEMNKLLAQCPDDAAREEAIAYMYDDFQHDTEVLLNIDDLEIYLEKSPDCFSPKMLEDAKASLAAVRELDEVITRKIKEYNQ